MKKFEIMLNDENTVNMQRR